jgi:pimeloyl-ACP methyl ester carboxylesterase
MPSITTSDGVRLDYTETGDPSGRPVILIAGFKAAATSWVLQQDALIDAGARVIAFDRRGHGTSEAPSFGARMSRHGKDLADLLAALDLYGAVLVGGSQGGSTIWAYASLFSTERLAGTVTVDQTPKMLNTADWAYGFYDYDRSTMGTMFERGVPPTGRGTPPAQRGERLIRLMAAMRIDPGRTVPVTYSTTELALLNDHAVQDWRDVIARLDVPSLFVAGRDSELWPCEHAAAAADLNDLASSVVIENCGHAANIEQPDRFNELVVEFIGTV